jgi:peptidoglycan/xylan/chitin deacetylase (PgdA/CDA1 family)
MEEIAVLVGLVLALAGAELAVWRLARGPARSGRQAAGRAVVALGLTLPAACAVVWNGSQARTFQLFGELVPRVETADPVVALTFDDGPSAEYTAAVLDILRAQQVPATFFVIGAELERNPAEARAIVADGHALGNHSYSHQRMVGLSYATVQAEIERTDALIRAAGYGGEIAFRPPYGRRLLALPYFLQVTGRTTVTWDVEPDSCPEVAADPERIVEHVLERARPGSIIILHVMYASRETSRQALPGIVAGLRARGYRFVTVPELLVLRPGGTVPSPASAANSGALRPGETAPSPASAANTCALRPGGTAPSPASVASGGGRGWGRGRAAPAVRLQPAQPEPDRPTCGQLLTAPGHPAGDRSHRTRGRQST